MGKMKTETVSVYMILQQFVCLARLGLITVKNQYRKFETNIPRKGIPRQQSQFQHSCICERFIYSHNRSAYSTAGNMWTDPGNI